MIGPYSLTPLYPYVESFHTDKYPVSYKNLYRYFGENLCVIAAFYVNYEHVCIVEKDLNFYMYDIKHNNTTYQSEKGLNALGELYPIGYNKTYSECRSILILPEHIYYCPKYDLIIRGNSSFKAPYKFKPDTELPTSLYKALINSDSDYVLVDADGVQHFERG